MFTHKGHRCLHFFYRRPVCKLGIFQIIFFLRDVWALSKPWDPKGNYSDIRSLFQQGNSSIHVCYMINRPWTEDAIPLNLKGSSPLYLSLWSTLVRDAAAHRTKGKQKLPFLIQNFAGPVNLLWWASKHCGARQPCLFPKAESKSQGAAEAAWLCSWVAYPAMPVGTQRQPALGNALCLATSSLREQAVEPHVNNAFGDYFCSRNLFWYN